MYLFYFQEIDYLSYKKCKTQQEYIIQQLGYLIYLCSNHHIQNNKMRKNICRQVKTCINFLGDQFKNQKKYSEAIQFYQLAIQIHPSRGYLRIGNALISQGRLEEAFTILNDARQYFDIQDFKRSAYEHLNNNQIDVFILFQKLALNMSDENNKIEIFLDFGNYKNYLQGDKMICKDQVEEAFKMYKLAAQYNPNCSLFLKRGQNEINRLGDDFFQDKKFDIALQFYELLTLLDPKQGYLKQGQYESYTQEILQWHQVKFKMQYLILKRLFKTKLEKMNLLKEVIIKIHLLGDLYFKLEKFDIALQFYELLCEINPLKGYMKLGDYESAQKNMEQAFSWFDKVIEFKPNDVHFYKELEKRGDKKFNEEQYQTALQFYKLETKLNKKMGFLKQGQQKLQFQETHMLNQIEWIKQNRVILTQLNLNRVRIVSNINQGVSILIINKQSIFLNKKNIKWPYFYMIYQLPYIQKLFSTKQIKEKYSMLQANQQKIQNNNTVNKLFDFIGLNKQFQQTKYNKNQDFISKSAWDYHKVLILQEQGIYRVSQQQKDKIEYVGQKLVQYK
ncbi:hypothetical protein pb186bvf_020752 [Paramecium bursaria]